MNEKEAREIIAKGEPHPQFECDMVPDYQKVVGYLEGLDDGRKEERDKVKVLAHHLRICVTHVDKTLMAYKEAKEVLRELGEIK